MWESVCYGLEGNLDPNMFEYVFRREAVRLWGSPDDQSNPAAAWDWLDNMTDQILGALGSDPLGVFSKRIAGDATNWRNVAAFANFYWWVNPEGREKLRQDILDGNAAWAEFMIDWARPRAPKQIMSDPAYDSRQALVASTWPTGGGSTGKGFGDTGPGANGIWPIELITGAAAAIPGLPPVCEPFPRCAVSTVPMALQAMWNLIASFVSATPGVVQVRDQQGLIYRPSIPPEDVATDEDVERELGGESETPWGWIALGLGAAAIAAFAFTRR
jgi:hypothetical protein